MVTSAQLRAARSLLNWTVRDLAEKAGVHRNTVTRAETDENARGHVMNKRFCMLQDAKVEFTNCRNRRGVSLKATRVAMPESDFLEGLEKFRPEPKGNVQFDGLRIIRDQPTPDGPISVELITMDGDVIGNVLHDHEQLAQL